MLLFRCKHARSAQNHVAYKRRNGRLGSATFPFTPPFIIKMARQSLANCPLFQLAFHTPEYFTTIPLDRNTLLSLHSQGNFTQGNLDVMDGLHLRLEQEGKNVRIDRFKRGDTFYLQRDIDQEMRSALAKWKELWKDSSMKSCLAEYANYDSAMDWLQMEWAARAIKHLQNELSILSTNRSKNYVASIQAHRVEVPEPCSQLP